MKGKNLLMAGCLSALLLIAALPGFQATAAAAGEQCYLVTIEDPSSSGGLPKETRASQQVAHFLIDPVEYRVPPNSCITWINQSKKVKVRIKFEEGMRCKGATTKRTGFKTGPGKCLLTRFLSHGAASSLVFTREGTYDYVVEEQGAGSQSRGKLAAKIIIVKK